MFGCDCGFSRNTYDPTANDNVNGTISNHNWKGYLQQFFSSGYFAHKVALIDLESDYQSLIGGHKGNFQREAKKCERAGFFIKEINYRTYITEVSEINRSKPIRCGRKMSPDYMKTVEQLGGQYTVKHPPETPPCKFHRGIFYGCFSNEPGFWGDGKLVAYIGINLFGNFANYSMIIGHGDYLKKGIMQFLHLQVLELLKANGFSRYVIYYLYFSGEENLISWKRRAGFRSYNLTFNKDERNNYPTK